MSNILGPNNNTNGLIFEYDMSNTRKSWKGAPTTNVYGSITNGTNWPNKTLHFWDGNNWTIDSTYTDPGCPGPVGTYLGIVYKYTSGALSSSWSGNSYQYNGRGVTLSNNVFYSSSAFSYVSTGCDITGINCTSEGTNTNNIGITGYNSYYDMNNKGTWQRLAIGCLGSGSNQGNYPCYAYKVGVTNGAFTGFFLFAMPMIEQLSYPSAPTESSRSSTQSLIDLTGQNTITVNNLTYAGDGTFSFNNSSDYITPSAITDSVLNSGSWTISSWVNMTSTSKGTDNAICGHGSSSGSNGLHIGERGNYAYFGFYANDLGGGIPLSAGNWYNLVYTYNYSTKLKTIYVNGVYDTSGGTVGYSGTGSNFQIGQYPWATSYKFYGRISSFNFYNRLLSYDEVKQNFSTFRGRYGI